MEKALIIQNKFIGDVLVSSLYAKNLKKLLNNNVEIHFFCYDKAIGVLENNPYIDKIISFDDNKLKKIYELFKMINKLKRNNYTIIIDPYAKIQSRIINLLLNAKIKSSFKKPFFSLFYTHVYKKSIKSKIYDSTSIENRLKLLNPFNPENIKLDDQTEIFLTKNELINGKKLIEKLNNKPILMIGALGSSKDKTWTIEYMALLINFLLRNYDFNILLNYVPNQKDEIKQLLQEVDTKNKKLFLEPLGKSIREMASILVYCEAFIGNEGGGINLAKALNIPSFSIYSPHKFKQDWGYYESQNKHESVHLKDIYPDLYKNINIKNLIKNSEILYTKLRYEYVESKIKYFIQKNLK